jgi:predicted patatin/cPLA2 family phospholipase
MKTGLVLEGGAMRGMFTCGVIDVLMENNVTFDGAVGVSAGAGYGVNYKSKQPRRAVGYTLFYADDPRFGSWRSLIKSGNMYDADFCYHDMHIHDVPFDFETFKNNPMEFYVVATDIKTGKPVYHKMTDGGFEDLEWIRASASMPLVSQVVELEGHELLDGGIADAIPLHFLESKGYDRNVVILTQPRKFIKERNQFIPMIRQKYKNDTHLLEDMESRHIRYNALRKEIFEREAKGELFVIMPEAPLNIPSKTADHEALIRVYESGRIVANKVLDDLIKYLNRT